MKAERIGIGTRRLLFIELEGNCCRARGDGDEDTRKEREKEEKGKIINKITWVRAPVPYVVRWYDPRAFVVPSEPLCFVS